MRNDPNTRKQIIVNEIKYWKETNLLPEQYCNFLLQLYSEGNNLQITSEKSVLAQRQGKGQALFPFLKKYSLTLIFFLILLSGSLLYYFSDIGQQMQISPIYIFIIFLVLTFILGVIKRIFAIQCLVLLMLILALAWLSNQYFTGSSHMWSVEAMWTVLGLLALGFSRIIEKHNNMLTLALYINGVIAFFMPTLLLFFSYTNDTNIFQFLVLIKLILLSISLIFWNPLVYIAQINK